MVNIAIDTLLSVLQMRRLRLGRLRAQHVSLDVVVLLATHRGCCETMHGIGIACEEREGAQGS